MSFFDFDYIFLLMNETIHERIKYLVDKLAGGKNTVFASKLGVSEANIRGYMKNVVPKADVLEKIVISYEVNAMWLLTGLGYETLPNQPQEVPAPLTDSSLITDFLSNMSLIYKVRMLKLYSKQKKLGV